MKHERAFADGRTEEKRRLDELIAELPPCPGVPATEDEVAAADERARADYAADRYYSHELVGEWLLTAGQPGYKPFKEWLAARNG